MSKRTRCGNSQLELFAIPKQVVIPLDMNDYLVRLSGMVDWTQLEILARTIRAKKVKNAAGAPPHYRQMLGAMVLRVIRYRPYRQLEDLIRNHGPARYLCGLYNSPWTPDFRSIWDFIDLMGEEGTRLINELVIKQAVAEGLADPTGMTADTTAQEAAVPYPNEMGLLTTFVTAVASTSKRAGKVFSEFVKKMATQTKAAKEKAREYRLFAKTKEAKDEVLGQMVDLVEAVWSELGKAVAVAKDAPVRVKKYGKVARQKLIDLHATTGKLLPQIRHWLKTGRVASGKIISLQIPELYSVVRGKVGKKVEFGLTWGIRRLRGGFLLGTVALSKNDLHDTRYAVGAVDEHIALFGEPPEEYAYDRGGWSEENVQKLRKKGVKQVGLTPRGKADWAVSAATKKRLVKERAQVEGGIGTIKHQKYGFNRPAARSARTMRTSGQLAILGFNLNKMVRELAKREEVELVG